MADSRGHRMLSLINNNQHGIINAAEYEITEGSSAGDKDAISKHVRVTDEPMLIPDATAQNPHDLQQKGAEPETTPSRPVFVLAPSCKRKLFPSGAVMEDENRKQDFLNYLPEPHTLPEDGLSNIIHKKVIPSTQAIVHLQTVEGGVGTFESLGASQIYKNGLDDSNEQFTTYACSKPLVEYSDTDESGSSDSVIVFNQYKFHSESNHSFGSFSNSSISGNNYNYQMLAGDSLQNIQEDFDGSDTEVEEYNNLYSDIPTENGKINNINTRKLKSTNPTKECFFNHNNKMLATSSLQDTQEDIHGSDTQVEDYENIYSEIPSHKENRSIKKRKVKKSTPPTTVTESSESDGSESEESDTHGPDQNDKISPDCMVVEPTSNTKTGRVYNKKSACFYCEKLCSKLPEHLELCHSDKIEVAKLLATKKGSKERRVMLKVLRNKGNFLYNKDILEKKKGKLLTCRRPPGKALEGGKFLPCEYCLGFYKKESLARHVAKCPLKPKEVLKGRRKNRVAISTTLANTSPKTNISKHFEVVLHGMRDDSVSLIARNDSLIMKYGNHLSDKYRDLEHLKYDVVQKMRELARLISCLREEDENITNLTEALKPIHFYTLLKAVQKLAGLDTPSGGKPTLALKVGYSLQKCIYLLKTDAIMQENSKKQKLCDNFLELYKLNWETAISKRALQRMDAATWNKPSVIPLAEDVLKLNIYIKNEQLKLYGKLKSKNSTATDYRSLAKVTLAHLITFNRKRVGEVERLEKSTYLNRVAESPQGEIEKSLTRSERILVNSFTLLHIRGKRGRKVPLLLTPEMVKMIDLIITKQSSFSVPESNKFIFARPNSKSAFRGSDAISYVATNSGAKNVNTLTSTRLRKHIATVSQILNLSTNDLELLSKHMGHSLNVHKDYYRLPDNTLELAKVSKLLIQFDRGNIEPGQTLDNISLDLPSDKETDDECEIDTASTESTVTIMETTQTSNIDLSRPKLRKGWKKSKKNVLKAPWTEEENQVIRKFFRRNIVSKRIPGKAQCMKCLSLFKVINRRSWVQVKSKVHNIIQSGKIM